MLQDASKSERLDGAYLGKSRRSSTVTSTGVNREYRLSELLVSSINTQVRFYPFLHSNTVESRKGRTLQGKITLS